ncbi:MAG TPA: hypothetical protein VGW38_12120 [Chloroflexota bacterium]|nr:hypothetical protein [Chloroflexota bacterium]
MALLCPDDIVRDVTFSAYPDSDDTTATGRRVQLGRIVATDDVPAGKSEFVVFDIGDVPSGFTQQGEVREVVPGTGLVEAVVRLDDGFRIEALAAPAELRDGLVLNAAGEQLEPEAFEARSSGECG